MSKVKVNVKIPSGFAMPSRDTLRFAMHALAAFARDRIVQQAQTQLSGRTAPSYLQGLHEPDSIVVNPDGTSATLTLVGEEANKIEQGRPSWDIKAALLKKSSKGYVDVPFRHGTPGSNRHGTPMPAADYNVMQSAVKRAQKALMDAGASKAQANRATVRGPRTMPTGPQTKTRFNGERTTSYTHKTSMYADMLRKPKVYARAVQSQYQTFRRVSKNSDPNSWIYPGIPGLNLFKKIAPEVEKIAPSVIGSYLKKL